jgi:hypothetical protein
LDRGWFVEPPRRSTLICAAEYSAALLAHRLGDALVTSFDIAPYLSAVAGERLGRVGLHPQLISCNAARGLPGQ